MHTDVKPSAGALHNIREEKRGVEWVRAVRSQRGRRCSNDKTGTGRSHTPANTKYLSEK
jgi:hypothetical protein